MPPRADAGRDALKPRLDRLYDTFNRPNSAADPVQFVLRYESLADREIVGFIAASLAFGRVASVLASIEAVLGRLGPHPAEAVRGFDVRRDARRFDGIVHRWSGPADITALVLVLRHMLREAGSIEAFFAAGHDRGAVDVASGLESFARRACAIDVRAAYGGREPARPGVGYFFPRPGGGSACKRLNLFLRWMVRRDAIDPGGWAAVAPSQLVIPLDTHVIRVGRCLRLTRYASPGWRMAADITASLRALDPHDPVRYDFALCHLGMMNACGFNRAQGDRNCPLRGWCRPRGHKRPASRGPSARR